MLLAALAVAYLTRDDPSPTLAVIGVVVGNLVVLSATGWTVRREVDAAGFAGGADSADGAAPLPEPAWWFPVAGVGLVDVAAGPAVTGWIGLGGAVLVVVALIGASRVMLRPAVLPDRAVVRAARRLQAVGGAGAPVVGALEPTGRSGVRVVAVGADGRWVDVVLRTAEQAQAAADLGGVELRDQADPSFSSAFALGPSAWSRLAGPS